MLFKFGMLVFLLDQYPQNSKENFYDCNQLGKVVTVDDNYAGCDYWYGINVECKDHDHIVHVCQDRLKLRR